MAVKTFTVSSGGIRIRVRLLPTIADVHREHQATARRCVDGNQVHAFFLPKPCATRYIGTIALPLAGGKLREYVPHEVTHAVIHALNGVLSHDDEACCTAIGRITALIFKRIEQIGVAI
jgi:hypothetical protein